MWKEESKKDEMERKPKKKRKILMRRYRGKRKAGKGEM